MENKFLAFIVFSFILFSVLLVPTHSVTNHRCHPDDYKVLVEINKTIFPPDHIPGWVPNTDCCNWYAIDCHYKTNRVNELHFYSNDYSGQIPPAIGDLAYLEYLTFRKLTNITGPIPRSLTKLKRLRYLRISWLNMTGPVPEFLSELHNLEFLELNFNQFSGSIPASFSKFTKLLAVHLDRNRLTGSIPESFGHFTGNVPDLYLSHNQLTGTIPKSLGNMNFDRLDLSRNKLVGDASMLFRPNGTTSSIDLSRNLLEFDFSKVRFPKTLNSLDLNHNRIYGSIPKELSDLQYFGGFNVSYNRLCGEIPTGGNFQSFEASNYIHNKCLCGPPLLKCT
ncbi:hypothetical protein AQUCO_00900341v1 [Aquilegia coerulea]|uniref:Uncharacterized protein n=1 Tax=Aquilegia coerulea TaxID=218851 RepID=A0A2G5ED51_AQUCA|nr:hypothetical protein AQUCO_00900341v1 [Aquilegia coerulea]